MQIDKERLEKYLNRRVDDSLFLKNLRAGIGDFKEFVKEIRNIL